MYTSESHWRLQSDRRENLLRVLSECERVTILCGFYVVQTHMHNDRSRVHTQAHARSNRQYNHTHTYSTSNCRCIRDFHLTFLYPFIHIVWLCDCASVWVLACGCVNVCGCGYIDERQWAVRLYVVKYMSAAAAESERTLKRTLQFAYVILMLISFFLLVAFISIWISKL